MNVIFEEGGQFKVARVLSATEANYQIELSTGKRSKVKRNQVIFEFEKLSITERKQSKKG